MTEAERQQVDDYLVKLCDPEFARTLVAYNGPRIGDTLRVKIPQHKWQQPPL